MYKVIHNSLKYVDFNAAGIFTGGVYFYTVCKTALAVQYLCRVRALVRPVWA